MGGSDRVQVDSRIHRAQQRSGLVGPLDVAVVEQPRDGRLGDELDAAVGVHPNLPPGTRSTVSARPLLVPDAPSSAINLTSAISSRR